MENILVTSPRYDDGTEYLSTYALEIIKRFNNQFSIRNFNDKNATKSNVEKYIKKKNPKLLFLNGHGNESEICGHKNEVIFSLQNGWLLNNKITYARSCFSANSLGVEAVKDNLGCFIGYRLPFFFWTEGERSATPLKDQSAKMFLEPSNMIVVSLLNQETCQDANKKSKYMMIKNMNKILTMQKKQEPGAIGMLQALWSNYEGQVVLGNKDARV